MPEYLVLFVVVFVIGIMSGFGLGSLILWCTWGKRIKAIFVVSCELIERFEFMMDAITDDDEEDCEDEVDGNIQADSV